MWIISFSSIICWKHYSFPYKWSLHLYWKIKWEFESLFLYVQFYSIDLYVYLYTSDTLFDDYSFEVKVSFGVRKFKSSNFVLLQDCLGYLGFLEFPYEFQDFFFCFCKNVLGISAEIA